MADRGGAPEGQDGDTARRVVGLWPATLRALAEGDQVLVVGLEAMPDGPVELVPVAGQRPDLLKVAYRRWVDDAGTRATAEAVERWQVDRWPAVEAVIGRTICTPGWATEVLGWAEGTPLHVAAVVVRPAGPDGPPAVSDTVLTARRRGLAEALRSA